MEVVDLWEFFSWWAKFIKIFSKKKSRLAPWMEENTQNLFALIKKSGVLCIPNIANVFPLLGGDNLGGCGAVRSKVQIKRFYHILNTIEFVGSFRMFMSTYSCHQVYYHSHRVSQPHCEASVRMKTHTPKSGNSESFGTPENSKLDCRSQNTLHWDVIYTVEKVLKCNCPKWSRMTHLDICSTSYGQKKGRESNWQFDSRPLTVRNRPNPGVFRWIATHCWKALEESYSFASDLIPIGGQSWELWAPKVPRVQTGTMGQKAIQM
jgi:hypothetical protein